MANSLDATVTLAPHSAPLDKANGRRCICLREKSRTRREPLQNYFVWAPSGFETHGIHRNVEGVLTWRYLTPSFAPMPSVPNGGRLSFCSECRRKPLVAT